MRKIDGRGVSRHMPAADDRRTPDRESRTPPPLDHPASPLAPLPPSLRVAQGSAAARPRAALPVLQPRPAGAREANASSVPATLRPSVLPADRHTLEERCHIIANSTVRTRGKEIEALRRSYEARSGTKTSRRAFVAFLYDWTTRRSGVSAHPTDQPDITRFTGKLHGSMSTTHVLRRDHEDGSLADLRVARDDSDAQVQALTKAMIHAARLARSKNYGQPTEKLAAHLRDLWNRTDTRRQEFHELYEACCKMPGNRHLSGEKFLQSLHELVDAPEARRSPAVNGIERCAIEPPFAGGRRIELLRRVYPDGSLADIRLLQPGQDENRLRDDMETAAMKAGVNAVPYSAHDVKRQRWKRIWRAIEPNFKAALPAFQELVRTSGELVSGRGSDFVRYMDDLCGKTPGVVLDAPRRITRHRIELPGGRSVALLRREDDNGLAMLMRLRDDLSDQATVLEAMIAKMPNRKAAAGVAPPSARSARGHAPASGTTLRTACHSAYLLKQALERMVENQRRSRYLFDGVEQASGLQGKVVRSWFDDQGGSSGHR